MIDLKHNSLKTQSKSDWNSRINYKYDLLLVFGMLKNMIILIVPQIDSSYGKGLDL